MELSLRLEFKTSVSRDQPPISRVRFTNLFKLGILAAVISWFYFQPVALRGQDMVDPPASNSPATESVTPGANAFATQTDTSESTTTTAPPAATGGDDNGGRGDFGTGKFAPLPAHLSASVLSGYDDNVTTSTGAGKQSSVFSTIALQLAYDMGDPRLQLRLRAGASGTYFWDHPASSGSAASQDYDVNINLGLSIVYRASPRLTLTAEVSDAYVTEPEFADRIGNVFRNGNFFYSQDRFNAAYLWAPRFQTVTSYTLFALAYDDSSIGLFEDRFDNTLGDEFRFIMTPETALVAEYRIEFVSYAHEGDVLQRTPYFDPTFHIRFFDRLLDRDSMSHFVLGGFDHTFSSRLSTSVRAGGEFRDYPDSIPHRVENAPYLEANLNYTAGKRTTLSWNNHYGLEEPETITNPVRTAFHTGLQASHAFTPKISGSAAVYYTHSDYHSDPDRLLVGFFGPVIIPGAAGFSEDSVDFVGQVSYSLSYHCSIEIGYTHTTVDSDHSFINPFPPNQRVFDRDYSRNRVHGGLTYSF